MQIRTKFMSIDEKKNPYTLGILQLTLEPNYLIIVIRCQDIANKSINSSITQSTCIKRERTKKNLFKSLKHEVGTRRIWQAINMPKNHIENYLIYINISFCTLGKTRKKTGNADLSDKASGSANFLHQMGDILQEPEWP